MTVAEDPNLDDVLVPTERAVPDHREHAKIGKHPDDAALEQRTEHERDQVNTERPNR